MKVRSIFPVKNCSVRHRVTFPCAARDVHEKPLSAASNDSVKWGEEATFHAVGTSGNIESVPQSGPAVACCGLDAPCDALCAVVWCVWLRHIDLVRMGGGLKWSRSYRTLNPPVLHNR